MNYEKIFLILFETTRNTGNLEEYFSQNTTHFYLYLFPPSFVEKESQLIYYKNRIKIWEKKFFWFRGKNKILKTIFYYLYYFFIVLFILPRKTTIITYQPLFCLFNSFLKLVKQTELVFCVGDYFPVRTNLITKLYHFLTVHYNKHLPYVLYPSPLYEKVYKVAKRNVHHHRDELKYAIKKMTFRRNPQKNLLGFISNLREGQGLELIFKALRKNKSLKLEIIGYGVMFQAFQNLSKKMKVDKRVTFYGFIKEEKDVFAIIKRWEIGLAPYNPSYENVTFYTDPSKVKFYFQYKIPVIMTRITYMSEELEKYHAGVTIDFTEESLLKAIKTIQNNHAAYLSGVDRLIQKYEYTRYYDKHLAFLRSL